jgi:hypothetical protein
MKPSDFGVQAWKEKAEVGRSRKPLNLYEFIEFQSVPCLVTKSRQSNPRATVTLILCKLLVERELNPLRLHELK